RGFPVSAALRASWLGELSPDQLPMGDRIQVTAAAKALYKNDGRMKVLREPLLQTDYARTLETLAEQGPDTFYRGEIAARIAADFQAEGGFITLEDLAGYQAEVTEPLESTYRGLSVGAPPPPAGRPARVPR